MGDYQVNDPIVITSRKLDQAISKLPQNKASGLDNISAEHKICLNMEVRGKDSRFYVSHTQLYRIYQ